MNTTDCRIDFAIAVLYAVGLSFLGFHLLNSFFGLLIGPILFPVLRPGSLRPASR